MRIGNCAFAISLAALTGLLTAGTAVAQPAPPAPPAGGATQPKPTTSTKLVEGKRSLYRRLTNAAARKFFKAQKDLYDSLCKSETAQRDVQAALDKAEKELDEAIAREVDEIPEVQAASNEAARVFRAWLATEDGTPEYKRLLHEQVEKHERELDLRRKATARIKVRIVEISDTSQPRRTSCGPTPPSPAISLNTLCKSTNVRLRTYGQRESNVRIRDIAARGFDGEGGGDGCNVNLSYTQMVAPSGPQIALMGGYNTFYVPTVNAGTVFSGGAERPIMGSASRLSGGGGAFRFSASPLRGITYNFGATFSQANASSNGFVAAGTDNVAQTYIFPNPVSGSTGINAGATGQSVSTETRYREFSAFGEVNVPLETWMELGRLASQGDIFAPRVTPQFSIGVHYGYTQRTDLISQQSVNFAGLNSATDLSATSNFIAPRFSAGVAVSPGRASGPLAGFNGFVAPGARMTSANATQNSRCNVCGGGSPETNVTLQRSFSETRFGVVSGAMAYAGYQISPTFKVQIDAAYENQTAAPVFNVPTTPTQQPITLGTGSVNTFRVGGRIVVNFAPPPPAPP